jgi:hypothetical protein
MSQITRLERRPPAARRVGTGTKRRKAADLAAIKIQARLAEGGDLSVLEPARPVATFTRRTDSCLSTEMHSPESR